MTKLFSCLVMLLLLGLQSSPPSVSAEKEPAWVDLLSKIDPEKHALAGSWTKTTFTLSTSAVASARLSLPWNVVTEYDFEVTFTRKTGQHSVALMFVHGGNQATFEIDGWGQHLAGIQNIAGQSFRDNPTRTTDRQLTNGQKYTALVKVRKDRVEAYVDGKLLTTYRGDGQDLSLIDLWRVPRGSLGIGAWDSETDFHQVRVRPVAGSREIASIKPAPMKTRPLPESTSPTPNRPATPSQSEKVSDDLSKLSDDFDDPASLKNWLRVYQTEKTQADQLQQLDIGQTRRGWMTMIPYTSSWYQDYRGVLVYKEVAGDFVVTTRVHATNRAGNGPPRSNYSLAGIMVRTPRAVTPQTWRPGGENYIFLSLGAASQPGQFAFEVKTTINSRSDLHITNASGSEAQIRVARIGSDFILLRKEADGPWIVHQRYRRSDMPDRLQVGFTVYTDYTNVSRLPPLQQNTQVIRGGNPDLKASFDFMHFSRPEVPSEWRGRAISNAQAVSDAEVLRVLSRD